MKSMANGIILKSKTVSPAECLQYALGGDLMDAATGMMDDQTPLVRALIGLTVVTGLVDAISFLGLGHIFTANMTGNVVFLGFAAGGAPGISAARSIAALCAFAGGSVCGGRLTSSRQRTPVAHMVAALMVGGLSFDLRSHARPKLAMDR